MVTVALCAGGLACLALDTRYTIVAIGKQLLGWALIGAAAGNLFKRPLRWALIGGVTYLALMALLYTIGYFLLRGFPLRAYPGGKVLWPAEAS